MAASPLKFNQGVQKVSGREDRDRESGGRSRDRERDKHTSSSRSDRRDHHHSRKRSRSPDYRRSKYDRERDDSRRSERKARATETTKSAATGATPLLFFAGNAKLKPFVPTEKRQHTRTDKVEQKIRGTGEPKRNQFAGESLMTIGSKNEEQFAFLKDDEDIKEWEAN